MSYPTALRDTASHNTAKRNTVSYDSITYELSSLKSRIELLESSKQHLYQCRKFRNHKEICSVDEANEEEKIKHTFYQTERLVRDGIKAISKKFDSESQKFKSREFREMYGGPFVVVAGHKMDGDWVVLCE